MAILMKSYHKNGIKFFKPNEILTVSQIKSLIYSFSKECSNEPVKKKENQNRYKNQPVAMILACYTMRMMMLIIL